MILVFNNTSNESGWNPFHSVCSNEYIEIIKLFLSSNRKIDLEKQTSRTIGYYESGTTCLDILKSKNINISKIKKIKISINQKLLFSVADGDIETLKALLKIRNKKLFS